MKSNYLVILVFFVLTQSLFAQNDTIMGVLLDINDKVIKKYPVSLGSVSPVKSKTDKYGIFKFPNVNLQDTLFVGDKKGKNLIAIPVNGYPFVTIKSLKGNFNMEYLSEPDERLLRYMLELSEDTKRSMNLLNRNDILNSGCMDVLCLLTRLNGITINGTRITMAGLGFSFQGATGPLIVVDKVVTATNGSVDDIPVIPVEEIEDISVLKDASMYGARGANGAILINTRKK